LKKKKHQKGEKKNPPQKTPLGKVRNRSELRENSPCLGVFSGGEKGLGGKTKETGGPKATSLRKENTKKNKLQETDRKSGRGHEKKSLGGRGEELKGFS